MSCTPVSASTRTAYVVFVKTSDARNAGTDGDVYIRLFGQNGKKSAELALENSHTNRRKFQPSNTDVFLFDNEPIIGDVEELVVWHDHERTGKTWHLEMISVHDCNTGWRYTFGCDHWFSTKDLPYDVQQTFRRSAEKLKMPDPRPWLTDTPRSYIPAPRRPEGLCLAGQTSSSSFFSQSQSTDMQVAAQLPLPAQTLLSAWPHPIGQLPGSIVLVPTALGGFLALAPVYLTGIPTTQLPAALQNVQQPVGFGFQGGNTPAGQRNAGRQQPGSNRRTR